MRTITEEIKLYNFDELSESIQNKIIDDWRINDQFFWGSELVASLDRFAEYTGINIQRYSLGGSNSTVNWNYSLDNCELGDLKGVRLSTWLINNWVHVFTNQKIYYLKGYKKRRISKIQVNYDCPLTGCGSDSGLIDPILKQVTKPDLNIDLNDLIQSCIDGFIQQYDLEYEYWQSEECVKEEINNSDNEYLINGSIYL
ncbi:MAG: hypothetical protein GY928_20885 [Colwellia sp.]|nr:hypothetical protein [Colwellia sp.]